MILTKIEGSFELVLTLLNINHWHKSIYIIYKLKKTYEFTLFKSPQKKIKKTIKTYLKLEILSH